MDWLNFLRSTLTVLALASFMGIVWWAYGARRKPGFDAAARLVLDDTHSPVTQEDER